MDALNEFEHGGLNSKEMRFHNYLIPVAAILSVFGIIYGWEQTQGIHFFLLISMYCLSVLGINIGYHRYFTHRSFECKPWFAQVLLFFATFAATGPLLQWVRTHWCHHYYVDEKGDPHSPKLGFFTAHMGWLFKDLQPNKAISPQDQKLLNMVNNNPMAQHSIEYYAVILLSLLIPGVIAGLWTQSFTGAWLGVVWGGFLRIILVINEEFGVNSFCHVFGKKTYEIKDDSRDNLFFGIVSLGEGWHNTHHKFPYSARHGLKWWQIDLSYYVIFLLEKCGVVWNVKLPPANTLIQNADQ